MNEVLDECEKLPLQKELSYQEKIETIRQYAQDGLGENPWRRSNGLPLRITGYYFRFSEITDPEVYALCVMRNWLVTIVHWIRRRGKMTEPLISIIVPVYRVESYLSRCVDSLLAPDLSKSGNHPGG